MKSDLVNREIPVLTPAYDTDPYDLVIEPDDEFRRLQIRTAFEATTDGAVRFRTWSARTRSSGHEREGHDGRVDLFAVYAPACDEVSLASARGPARRR
ncbi:group I intron-associated PD-(D/E)XK endonuclease [Halorubrum sp. BOL3-1]|uniref:group I intron-associated PD-(D/E)XK endonuclease n=1 Tax=Halorubrum sp. BOL3-1 TaxID=2497325 RepID=UPI001F5020C6|nr:group I intron-associated PD-(D/E)XK endonuclease [Halorubrum sp. BOL3-1]